MLHGVVGGFSCPGPWTGAYEARYQSMAGLLERVAAADAAAREELVRQAGSLGPAEFIAAFEQLRFGRLCAFLRQREPDDEVGHSILIYRLTDDEVGRAQSPATPAPVQR
jgi:hypothetical protein